MGSSPTTGTKSKNRRKWRLDIKAQLILSFFCLSKGVIDDLYSDDFFDDKDYNKIHMKPIVQEKVSTKKERKKEDLEL